MPGVAAGPVFSQLLVCSVPFPVQTDLHHILQGDLPLLRSKGSQPLSAPLRRVQPSWLVPLPAASERTVHFEKCLTLSCREAVKASLSALTLAFRNSASNRASLFQTTPENHRIVAGI